MAPHAARRAFLIVVLTASSCALAQMQPTAGNGATAQGSTFPADEEQGRFDYWFLSDRNWADHQGKPEEPGDAVSKLDLMAPGKVRAEYNKGLVELSRKNFTDAVAHLEKALAIYPKYVSAHNALGTAYMNLGQKEKARAEFKTALALDDHLPNTYTNLSRACLSLEDYPAAVQFIAKASSISPLNLQLRVLLAYAELMNKDYLAVIATAEQVHGQKHEQAAVVHYFAAAAQQAEHNLEGMQEELQQFLQEDPGSANASQAREFLAKIDASRKNSGTAQTTISYTPDSSEPTAGSGSLPSAARRAMAQFELQRQLEAAECDNCAMSPSEPDADPVTAPAPPPHSSLSRPRSTSPWTLRSTVDEVGVFFAVTDGGRAVSDLSLSDVKLLDDRKAPAAVLGFRNEGALPLRLGLVIDTSASVTSRFGFEQDAAAEFLQQVLTGKKDLAFVTGVANSILMVQDFTASQNDLSAAIHKLAPAGGTALWDAVAFAAEKLGQPEATPVARILVVVSDGEDNSSSVQLKQAIETAQRQQVTVYTVSSRYETTDSWLKLGDRALQALAQQTGGTIFLPGSLGHLRHSLSELQQVIRSRYLISYKPAQFTSDGHYRSIEIAAQKSGHKLHVYSRKGYYASASASSAN